MRQLRVKNINHLLCAGMVWLGLHTDVCSATSVLAPLPCSPLPPPRVDDKGRLETPADHLYGLLASETADPHCLGQQIPAYFGDAGIKTVLGMLKSDRASGLRAHAALIVAGFRDDRSTAVGALSHDLAMEHDDSVLLAKLAGLADILAPVSAAGEGQEAWLPALVDDLERATASPMLAGHDARADQFARAFARVLHLLGWKLSDARSKTMFQDRVLLMAARVLAPDATKEAGMDDLAPPTPDTAYRLVSADRSPAY